METKIWPNIVLLSLIVLGLVAVFGGVDVATDFGDWYRYPSEALPLALIGRSLIYVVIPMLAFLDMVRGRSLGRYLGLVPLLYLFGVALRAFTDQLSAPFSQRPAVLPMVLPTFIALILLAALILKLGFGKEANAFFSTET